MTLKDFFVIIKPRDSLYSQLLFLMEARVYSRASQLFLSKVYLKSYESKNFKPDVCK